MKTRQGFVSNSSSSSFIINNLAIIKEYNVDCVKLNDTQISGILKDYPDVANLQEPLYLTEYISDSSDDYGYFYGADTSWCIAYLDGNHGYPYNENRMTQLLDKDAQPSKVWIEKDHNIGESRK